MERQGLGLDTAKLDGMISDVAEKQKEVGVCDC